MNATTPIADLLAALADPVPVLDATRPAAQGDVLILPAETPRGLSLPIPPDGLIAVAGTHNHVLHGDGTWRPGGPSDLSIGVLVARGDVHLLHLNQTGHLSGEHGAVTIPAGSCVELRGQRETAREGGWRRVAD